MSEPDFKRWKLIWCCASLASIGLMLAGLEWDYFSIFLVGAALVLVSAVGLWINSERKQLYVGRQGENTAHQSIGVAQTLLNLVKAWLLATGIFVVLEGALFAIFMRGEANESADGAIILVGMMIWVLTFTYLVMMLHRRSRNKLQGPTQNPPEVKPRV